MSNSYEAKNKKVLIVGVTSGIGEGLAQLFLKNKALVSGTYRNNLDVDTIDHEINSYHLDLTDPDSIDKLCNDLKNIKYQWDILILSVATLEPIGPFLSISFDKWKDSFDVNYFGQLELLHSLHKFHAKNATVVFFTGGAPNGVLEKYSAYSVAKIGLTKMVEYLDQEDPSVKYTIIGPGWVNTKIHKQTLHANEEAGGNFERTEEFLEKGGEGTPILDIYNCIDWLVEKPKDLVGGRNFSVVWDKWGARNGNDVLRERLKNDVGLYKLRRREPEF